MRRAALLAALALLPACFPVVAPIEEVGPANPLGPEVVVLLENASGTEATVDLDFEAPRVSGGGTGIAAACSRLVMMLGEVAGAYRLSINGEQVVEGITPEGFEHRVLLFEARIGPEGAVEVTGAMIRRVPPDPGPEAVAGCR